METKQLGLTYFCVILSSGHKTFTTAHCSDTKIMRLLVDLILPLKKNQSFIEMIEHNRQDTCQNINVGNLQFLF